MINNLALTQNAQFFSPRGAVDDIVIADILEAASENQVTGTVFLHNQARVDRAVREPDFTYKYSLRIYTSERDVHFIQNVELLDTIHSFILILEIGGHIAVLRKSTANIAEILQNKFDLVEHGSLINSFNDDDVEFQKLSFRNMTVSDKAIRAKSYEARDLKGAVSVHAAGRSIPYFLKVRHGTKLRTITTTTARIVESAERKGIDGIAIWAKEQIDRIAAPTGTKTFLDAFAAPVELKDVLAVAEPKAILIEMSSFLDHLEGDGLRLYKRKPVGLVEVRPKAQEKLFHRLEQVYEIGPVGNLVNGPPNSIIKKNQKTITFKSPLLEKIILVAGTQTISLQKYLVKNAMYSICFSDPKYMYFKGSCFEDRSGVSEIDGILGMLVTKAELNAATSEKGAPIAASTQFDATSIFGIVEAIHANDDQILCDDLGNEWADHITFSRAENSVSFIHSKHGDTSTSASNLHEVVGQGIKNLGNMFFDKNHFLVKKKDKIRGKYNLDGVRTNIPRLRKGTPATLNTNLETILGDFRVTRKCILCCTFLSKSAVQTEFSKIQRGRGVPGYVIQLLWILSSFAHAAKEMNVVPVLYCKP